MRYLIWLNIIGLMLTSLGWAADPATTDTAKNGASGVPEIVRDLPEGTYALFKTNHGEFVAKLHTDKAPVATANFIGLAKGTKEYTDPRTEKKSNKPYYDGSIFHRTIPGFMIQGGDPTGTGMGGPGYSFEIETHPDLRHDKPGVLSMANTGRPNSNGAQFFVTVAPQPRLDRGYTVFGQVVKGMSVVQEISAVPTTMQSANNPEQSRPITEVRLEQVKIYRIGPNGQLIGNMPAATGANETVTTSTARQTTETQKKNTSQKKKRTAPPGI